MLGLARVGLCRFENKDRGGARSPSLWADGHRRDIRLVPLQAHTWRAIFWSYIIIIWVCRYPWATSLSCFVWWWWWSGGKRRWALFVLTFLVKQQAKHTPLLYTGKWSNKSRDFNRGDNGWEIRRYKIHDSVTQAHRLIDRCSSEGRPVYELELENFNTLG